ncbi:hypothetical protein ACR3K2_17970 [Cryptosporidium serpentis]
MSSPLSGRNRRYLSHDTYDQFKKIFFERDFNTCINTIMKFYNDGCIFLSYEAPDVTIKDLDLSINYRDPDKISESNKHLYDICGIHWLSYLIHCYLCLNDITNAYKYIREVEVNCFNILTLMDYDPLVWESCYSLIYPYGKNEDNENAYSQESQDTNIRRDIFFFFRIHVIQGKLMFYKLCTENNTNTTQQMNDKSQNYEFLYTFCLDDLYLLLNEVDVIFNNLKRESSSNLQYRKWFYKLKTTSYLLCSTLVLHEYYQEAIYILDNYILKYNPNNIPCLSVFSRLCIHYGDTKLFETISNRIQEILNNDETSKNSVNIATHRFNYGLLNLIQDDPVAASLDFSTSAALYKELSLGINFDLSLSANISTNNLAVAYFYSTKLQAATSLLESCIYGNRQNGSRGELSPININNLRTLYQFSTDRDKLIEDLKKVSYETLKFDAFV